MASNAGDMVKALCSHCKVEVDAQVVAAVGDEIVTVTCRTCGTSQRYRPSDGDSGLSRRVVDVEPRRGSKRPRNQARRVVSTTGREIPDSPPPRPRPAEPEPQRIVTRTAPAPSPDGPSSLSNEALFRRWDAATDRVDARYARPHRAHESYEVGEAVLDKAHGMGIVEHVAEDGTLTVLFKRGHVPMPSVPKHLRPSPSARDDDDDFDDEAP